MSLPKYVPKYIQASPYHYTRITTRYMGYYIHRPIPPKPNDIEIEITARYVNRPDLLAFDTYGTEDVWWIIPIRNEFQDPVFDLKLGMVVMAPDLFEVKGLI